MALFGLYQLAAVPSIGERISFFTTIFGGVGLALLGFAFYGAVVASLERDRRCLQLQSLMLVGYAPGITTKPGQADPKDQFQAFGCRLRSSMWF